MGSLLSFTGQVLQIKNANFDLPSFQRVRKTDLRKISTISNRPALRATQTSKAPRRHSETKRYNHTARTKAHLCSRRHKVPNFPNPTAASRWGAKHSSEAGSGRKADSTTDQPAHARIAIAVNRTQPSPQRRCPLRLNLKT